MSIASRDIIGLPRYEKFALIAAPLLIGVSAWLDLALPTEADKAWLLHVARLWLEGHKLYVDVVEVNPPLVVWLYALPVWVSLHVPGLTDSAMLAFFGLLGCVLSIGVSIRLIQRHPAFAGNALRQVEFALLQGLIFIFYTSQLYFFDRDHIFLVLTFPYILRFMPSLAREALSLKLRLLIGCMAAVGFCIKPHTVIVFGALQLFALLRERSFGALLSVENAVVAAASLTYLLCTLYFTPDYFKVVVPVAIATYSEFANHGEGWAYVPPIIVSLGLVFADFRSRQATPYRRDVPYFFGICLAFIAYSLSNNGWGYTYNPMRCITIFTTGWMLWEYDWLRRENKMHRWSIRSINFGMRGCIIVFIMQGAYMVMYLFVTSTNLPAIQLSCVEGPHCWRNNTFVRYMRDHQIHSFGTLSLDFGKWVLFMRLPDVHWDTRFNHLWMIPQLVLHGEPYIQSHYWIVEYVGQSLADDLNRRKPEMVWVDSSPGFMGMVRRFDYAMFLSRVPQFKEAWSHYRYTYTLDTCGVAMYGTPSECRYDIYARTP